MEITEEYLLFQDLWRSNDYKDLKKGGILLYAGRRHHDSVHAVCSLSAQDIYAGETLWYRNGVTVCADCFPRLPLGGGMEIIMYAPYAIAFLFSKYLYIHISTSYSRCV